MDRKKHVVPSVGTQDDLLVPPDSGCLFHYDLLVTPRVTVTFMDTAVGNTLKERCRKLFLILGGILNTDLSKF